jgi:hypothetical protein
MLNHLPVWSNNTAYRRQRTAQWQEALRTGWQDSPWHSIAASLAVLEDFQTPQFSIPGANVCVDAVATVLLDQLRKRCYAFMNYDSRSAVAVAGRARGVGKTSAALHSLGVCGIDIDRHNAEFSFDFHPTRLRLVASDMGFFFAERGRLKFSPASGEAGLCAWDLVRLLSRLTGDERDQSKLRLLRELPDRSCNIAMDAILTAIPTPCQITDVIAFDERADLAVAGEMSVIPVDNPQDGRAILHNCLCDALRQASEYWQRPPERHADAACRIVEEIRCLPRVWISRRSRDSDGPFQRRVGDLANVIQGREPISNWNEPHVVVRNSLCSIRNAG